MDLCDSSTSTGGGAKGERPLQRSSSFKHPATPSSSSAPAAAASSSARHDRSSARRRTCLPVLHTKEGGGQAEDEDGDTLELVVIEMGGEQVELVPGRVWKHTKGENLRIECQMTSWQIPGSMSS